MVSVFRGFNIASRLAESAQDLIQVSTRLARSGTVTNLVRVGGRAVDVITTTQDLLSLSNEIAKEVLGNDYLNYGDDLTAFTKASLEAHRLHHQTIEMSRTIDKLNAGMRLVYDDVSIFSRRLERIEDLYEEIATIITNIQRQLPQQYTWVNIQAQEPLDRNQNDDPETIEADRLFIGLASGDILLKVGVFSFKQFTRIRHSTAPSSSGSAYHPDLVVEGKIDTIGARIRQRIPSAVISKVRVVQKIVGSALQMGSLVSSVFGLRSFITGIQHVQDMKQQLQASTRLVQETSKYLQLAMAGCSAAQIDEVAHYFQIEIDGNSPDAQNGREMLTRGLTTIQADTEKALVEVIGASDSSASGAVKSDVKSIYELVIGEYQRIVAEQSHLPNGQLNFISPQDSQNFHKIQNAFGIFTAKQTIALDTSSTAEVRYNALRDIGIGFTDSLAKLFSDLESNLQKVRRDIDCTQEIVQGTWELLHEWWLEKDYLEKDENQDFLVECRFTQSISILGITMSLSPDQKSLMKQKLVGEIEQLRQDYEENHTKVKTSRVWNRITGNSSLENRTHWQTENEVESEVIRLWQALNQSISSQDKVNYVNANQQSQLDLTLEQISIDLNIPIELLRRSHF
ncbi:hypothetical protein [Coleofasciculus sp. E1-EBD-02]|uniref:hypothetical protein n=1 Tax=Coleofasciculus sp. E1-EBD-02 TaxID=3068481 RepID=UPI0032F3AC78